MRPKIFVTQPVAESALARLRAVADVKVNPIATRVMPKKDLIAAKPSLDSCVSACHHPPHVEAFDAKEKVKLILGKGHGM